MAQFLHLTDERLTVAIARNGVKPSDVWNSKVKYVFATPVLKDFSTSHQWLRELKRRGVRTIAAIQFRIPDDEPVKVGRYNHEPLDTTAVGAIRVFREHESGLGLQVLIPRTILPKEIRRIYVPTQLVGWRYYPETKGRKPCGARHVRAATSRAGRFARPTKPKMRRDAPIS
jgi:hypothetical protein